MVKRIKRYSNPVRTVLDHFTYNSLQDLAVEKYEGNVSKAIREIIVEALERWDRENADKVA